MLLNDSSGYFFFSWTLSLYLHFLSKNPPAGVLTSRVGFQLLGLFYQNFTTSQAALADEFLRNT